MSNFEKFDIRESVDVTWDTHTHESATMRLRKMLDELGTENPATKRLRKILDKRGVKWADLGKYTTRWIGFGNIEYFAIEHFNRELDLSVEMSNLTPEQAVEATLGKAKKGNPRNYIDGQPKIPNMTVDADPDWVDWVSSLRHEQPRNVGEAVEQIAYEAICFGGDMGPNGNVWNGVDEGSVLTDGAINNWVSIVESVTSPAIVFCKDCQHAHEMANGRLACAFRPLMMHETTPLAFCSDGKREEGLASGWTLSES